MALFEPGQSGNPEGRPKGIRDKRTELRGMLLQNAPELVAKLVQMAKDGDATALRICMDRLLPAAKVRDDPVSLPTLTDSLADNSRAVIKALGEGELTPEEAATVLQALASQVRIIEADEIEKRLAALELAAGRKEHR